MVRLCDIAKELPPDQLCQIDSDRAALKHFIGGTARDFLASKIKTREDDTPQFILLTQQKIQNLFKAGAGYSHSSRQSTSASDAVRRIGRSLMEKMKN